MDAYIKPEIQKTIKRLSQQKNHEVLKNKLRSWIITREVTVTDLIRACREKTINVPSLVLNKLGILYGSGKEGLNEEPETAFVFYLAAADLGNASAAGNVAQYYFDGRAPGGRNVDASYEFCHKAVEGGTDKFMLLSEILHEKRDYKETVRCLRKIIESKKMSDSLAKKKAEARKLEIQCFFKLLDQLFCAVSLSDGVLTEHGHTGGSMAPMLIQTALGTPLQPPFSPQGVGVGGRSSASTPVNSLSARRVITSPVVIPSPRPSGATLALSQAFIMSNGGGGGYSSPYKTLAPVPEAKGDLRVKPPAPPSGKSQYNDPNLFQHHLPGWAYISEELEGFDTLACSQLTARAAVLELEAEALRSAYETAEARVSLGKEHKFSDEVITALMKNKVHEFQELYHSLQMSKATLLQTWNYYTDISEHILRRQIVTEKRFFNPVTSSNPLVLLIARELCHRRMYDYPEYLDADWSTFYTPEKYLNEPLNLSTINTVAYRIPCARMLVAAERGVLEVSMDTYGRSQSVQRCQQTGWTGQLNLGVYQPGQAAASADDGNKGTSTTSTPSLAASVKVSTAQLLQEFTFVETVVIGSAVLRYQHHTHPHLPPPAAPTNKAIVHEVDRHGKRRDFASSAAPSVTHHFSEEDMAPFDGYYNMQELGCSDDILRFLNHLTCMDQDAFHYKENEKKLVELMLRFLREGRPFNAHEVQMINEDASEHDCTALTRIAYHYFVKRLVPWVLSALPQDIPASSSGGGSSVGAGGGSGRDSVVQYYSDCDLPLASAQGRALQLVAAGALTFSEVFVLQSPYGIFYFTDPNYDHVHESAAEKKQTRQTYAHLRQQIINVNALYQKAILEASTANFAAFIGFWKARPHGSTVPTYNRLLCELANVYGDPEVDETDPYGSEDRELDFLMSKLKI